MIVVAIVLATSCEKIVLVAGAHAQDGAADAVVVVALVAAPDRQIPLCGYKV